MPDMDIAPTTTPATTTEHLPIRFTGRGGEYFRIWVVNLLLTLVTLSLYLPFAKARRLQWFYAHTEVGGHALAFHGDPWRMLRGHLLLLVAFGIYAVVGQVAPLAGGLVGLALAALWPALWRAGMRFRLANTSWRGVRFAFLGGVGGAYGALAPLLLVGVVAGLVAGVGVALAQHGSAVLVLIPIVMLVGGVVFMTWTLARIKRYQHNNYAWANQRTRLDVGLGAWYALVLRVIAVSLLLVALGLVAMAVAGGVGFAVGDGEGATASAAVVGIGVYLAMLLVPAPYFLARMQNLLWSHTASEQLRFESKLGFVPLLKLNALNWLLTVLTLGLYRPFAVVAMARLRLEAVSVHVAGDVNEWTVTHRADAGGTAGEAAGDFFDIDVGL